MEQLFDSLKKVITPETISGLSSVLGEDQNKVSSTVGVVVPSILRAILQKGDDSKIESLLKQAGNILAISNITELFSGQSNSEVQEVNSNFLEALFWSKLGSFSSLIFSVSGLGDQSTSKLLGIISPLVAGFLGKKLLSGISFSNLLGQISSEKNNFLSAIPEGLTGILGVSSLSGLGSSFFSKAADETKEVAENVKEKVEDTYHEYKDRMEKKSSWSWLKWLIIVLLLGFLLLWLFSKNSCSKSKEVTPVSDSIKVDTLKEGHDTISIKDQVVGKLEELMSITLPSGLVIKAYPNGIEDQMVKFLQSDEYKKASSDDLKEKWFNFDAINFEFGSGTKLTPASEPQIKNIAAIFKEFPNAKIKIGAYTDKKGNDEANLKLSQERANTIKEIFVKDGIGNHIVGAEGYGSKYAKVEANASDAERATDRRISLRFEK